MTADILKDNMSRENTGTVEQTASAAHDLKRLAEGLAAIVSRFKV